MKKYILILITLFVFTSCKPGVIQGVESSVYTEDNVQNVKIVNQDVPIREGCSNDTSVVETANTNDQYKVLNKVADWYAVQMPDNSVGFVPSEQCKPVVDESQPIQLPPSAERTPAQQPTPDTGNNNVAPNNTGNDANEEKADKDNAVNNEESTSDEQEMLALINKERTANNLQPLQADSQATNVARIKSQDMIDNNYFSHNSPTYGSPFDMLKQFGVHYVAAGENIAGNSTLQAAHDALMNSPGHRANILKPEYTHIGIGIINGGQYGKMFTQAFISKPK